MGWPAGGDLRLHSLYRGNPYLTGAVCSVRLLGAEGELRWSAEDDGVHIKLPEKAPNEAAFAFRIATRGSSRQKCGAE